MCLGEDLEEAAQVLLADPDARVPHCKVDGVVQVWVAGVASQLETTGCVRAGLFIAAAPRLIWRARLSSDTANVSTHDAQMSLLAQSNLRLACWQHFHIGAF